MKTDHGADPLGNGIWRLVPSGEIVDAAGLKAWQDSRPKRELKPGVFGYSWEEIERMQGGRLRK